MKKIFQKFVFIKKIKIKDFLNNVPKTRNFEFKEKKYVTVEHLKKYIYIGYIHFKLSIVIIETSYTD